MTRLVPLLILVFASGCQVGFFHCDTKWNPDDSVDRAILQPVGHGPDDKDRPNDWDAVTWGDEISHSDLSGDIRDLPIRNEQGDFNYFAAWKTVGPGELLPEHYERKGGADEMVSRFRRSRKRRDLGVLVEYTWTEELTENVTLNGMHRARKELLDLATQAVESILGDGLGAEYRFDGIIGWLRGDGRRAICDVTDTWYELLLSRREISDDEANARFEEILNRYGIKQQKENDFDLEDIAMQVVAEHLKRADGEAVDLAVQQAVARLLAFEADADESPHDAMLLQAAKVYADRYPGGKDVLEARLKKLESRMLGVHGRLMAGNQSFQFTMTLPGQIVSTNGVLLDDSGVVWSFDAQDAYPNGFRMHVRSIEDLSGKVSGVRPFTGKRSRQRMLDLIALLEKNSRPADEPPEPGSVEIDLIDLLKECREAGSLKPLKDASDGAQNNPEHRATLEQLWSLLQARPKQE